MPKVIKEKGFFGIGIYQPKREENIGTLWRSAYILGASFIFTVNKKYKRQQSDVLQSWRHIPLHHYDTFEEMYKALPYNSRLVGVELSEKSIPIHEYDHPTRAVYLLGSEDNGLPNYIIDKCHELVQLEGNHSLNVAVAGSILVHDRAMKRQEQLPDFEYAVKRKNRS